MKVYKNESSAYVVRMPHHEQKAFVSDSYLIPIYQELASLNVCREEGEPMVIPSGSRYEPVLAVMAEYCQLSKGFVPVKRFLALVKLILLPSEKVDFAGKRAYELMQQLYWLTPGGQNPDACLPEMTDKDEPILRVHKETVQEKGAPKTTIILTLPEKSNILRRMIGTGGATSMGWELFSFLTPGFTSGFIRWRHLPTSTLFSRTKIGQQKP